MIIVTNRHLCQGDFLERIAQIARLRPQGIILREKDLLPEDYELLAAECLKICSRWQVPLVVNTFIEAARNLQIPSIHLPLETFLQRREELSGFRIGVSVHSAEEARLCARLGAAYLMAGHIFPTDCKKGLPPRGLDFLQEVCAAVSIPIFAIGGIIPHNVEAVLLAGAQGICVMSQLMTCTNPAEVLAAFRSHFPAAQ
jgi:thiamine-phosphate pyrophosphorylase